MTGSGGVICNSTAGGTSSSTAVTTGATAVASAWGGALEVQEGTAGASGGVRCAHNSSNSGGLANTAVAAAGGVVKGGGILRAGSSRLAGVASGAGGAVRPGSAERGGGAGGGKAGGGKKVGMVVLEEGGVDLAVEARLRDLLEFLPEDIRMQV